MAIFISTMNYPTSFSKKLCCGRARRPNVRFSATGSSVVLLRFCWCACWCAILAAVIFGCQSHSLSPLEESNAAHATLAWLGAQEGFLHTKESSELLKRLASRLGRSVQGRALELQLSRKQSEAFENYRWQVYLLDSKQPNAFSLGAGIIVVTRGMLLASETEAQFAAVLCHETAHQLLGHTSKALSEFRQDQRNSSPQVVFSLEQEIEADALGLRLLELSGYDISEARFALTIDYRQKAAKVSLPPDWLITRMAYLQQQIELPRRSLPLTRTTREYSRVRKMLS